MSSINILNIVKVLQAIITLIVMMLHLEAELLIAKYNCVEKERRALVNMKEAFVDDYGRLSSWASSPDCCRWSGVLCHPRTGHVHKLDLSDHQVEEGMQPLRGEISPSLKDLQHLIYLNLSYNDFNWSHIPKFVASLTKLRYLDLSYSFFGGEIITEMGNLLHLRVLNLFSNDLVGSIPFHLANLSSLQQLRLGGNHLMGTIPSQLGNLSRLEVLWLGNNDDLKLYDKSPLGIEWLSNLHSLTSLDLSAVSNLNYSNNLLPIIGKLPNLSELFLLNCGLTDINILPTPPSHFNFSTSLMMLNLASNRLTSSIFPLLFNLSSNLVDLYLHYNDLGGPIDFGKHLNSLETLDLSYNKLNGPIPVDFGKHLNSLVRLDLSHNELNGLIPVDFGKHLNSLVYLDLSYNELNGFIPVDFRKHLNSLVYLDLSYNKLNGTISDVHLNNLTKLQVLALSVNLLSLKFTNYWIPPFQLRSLILSDCKLGPGFPKWLRTQNNLETLVVSHAEINAPIPEWFWRIIGGANYLNIEFSNLTGIIPDQPFSIPEISLASNQIEGSIPLFLLKGKFLDISGNQISKFDLSCGKGISAIVENLVALNLSGNNLSGELPSCWDQFKSLRVIDLSNNHISGSIPNSLMSSQLRILVLRNNRFSGWLPFLKNTTELGLLDLEKNELSGPIPPSWTRENFKELETMSLRMNKLDGKLPPHLCYLTKVRVLDLSFNKFTGPIPSCLDQLDAMTQRYVVNDSMRTEYFPINGGFLTVEIFNWYLPMVWKGIEQVYNDKYGLISIDLSHNQLVGEMPAGIDKLVELRFLNLSANKLSGRVIPKIGQLKSLEALDLSRNYFDGEIPLSLAEISSLSILDVSDNNFSGEIPTGTQLQSFDPSRYEGNPYLCGRPLDILCSSEDRPLKNGNQGGDEHDPFMTGFYESLGVGFGVGFWIVFGSLLVMRSWRHAYFYFVSNLSDSVYVTTMLLVARWRSWCLRN